MPQVCRTCLEEIADINCIRLSNTSFNIKEELRTCLPEVDVELVPNAVMCIYCVNELHSCYDFKQKCLFTEKQIRTQLHSQTAIDLSELKKANTVEVLNGNGVQMDVVYINDTIEGAGELFKNCESVVNGTTVNDTGNPFNSDDDDDDDINCSNLVLGLCESAPRKPPPPPPPPQVPSSPSKPETSKPNVPPPPKAPSSTSKPETSKTNPPPPKAPVSTSKPETSKTNAINSIAPVRVMNSAKKSTTKGAQSLIPSTNKAISLERIIQERFTCAICKAKTNNVNNYISHMKNSHKGADLVYRCSKCPYETKQSDQLIQHHVSHNKSPKTNVPDTTLTKSYKCPHCNFTTSDLNNLNKHIDTHILKCSKCYYVATSRSAYQKHISTHTLTLESDEVVVIEDDEDLPCKHCSFIAKGSTQFENHCLNSHGIRYPYICKDCGYTAGSVTALAKHAAFHVGNRSFQCQKCSYNCDLVYNLNKHVASRHSEK